MSLLINESYANPSRPLWASASTGSSVPPTQVLLYRVPAGDPGGEAPYIIQWGVRPLNAGEPALLVGGGSAVIAGMGIIDVDGNSAFTLPAGTYSVVGNVVGNMTTGQARIWNITTSSVALLGTSAGPTNCPSCFAGRITTTGETFRLDYAGLTTLNDNDWGLPTQVNTTAEIYSQLSFTKIA